MVQESSRLNEAMGRLIGATGESWRALIDGAFAVQRQNAQLALGWFGDSVQALNAQAEAGRRAVDAIAEQSEKQREALQALSEESARVWVDLLYAPLSLWAPSPSQGERRA
ncbi:hypothetical protein Rxyl_2077 [Rubrobacter xylanophilus DSM 9941]|uniref:Phasin domain-containing protein n=1 Tax=Rubrobacter xylanophilus (strain DSM 9941 / JCM 11954 / NBRC 16129 / PRD-1) TaxID=266117 RepID=Q1AUA6_RUBXD|nr:hypothetical protein [Rubrobacter xylanophilus]ABG05022.1 hypothetical protein Rxyl_2077 [Rubrobacter xylanophilus DSM 9941]